MDNSPIIVFLLVVGIAVLGVFYVSSGTTHVEPSTDITPIVEEELEIQLEEPEEVVQVPIQETVPEEQQQEIIPPVLALENYTLVQKADDYMSIQDVQVSVYNEGETTQTFTVKLFLYDDNDDPFFHRVPMKTFQFEQIPPKEQKIVAQRLNIGFNEIKKEKSVKLRLLDANKIVIKEEILPITFSQS